MGTQGKHRDERNLLGGRPEKVQYASGGTNDTSRVMLSNGVTGYHKPFSGVNNSIARGFGQDSAQQPIHEVSAWRLAEQLGEPYDQLVPPCVIREVNGEVGSFAMERPGKPGVPVTVVPEEERRSAAFFDALIGQQDRHHHNYLMAGDRVTLIDHGYAFARRGDFLNWSMIQQERVGSEEKVRRLNGAEIAALDKFLDSQDGLGLQGLLESPRFTDLVSRAEQMRRTGMILPLGEYA